LALVPRPAAAGTIEQPVIIGDCSYESFIYGPAASAWTPAAVVRRVGAICQNVKKASALLRAYDISAHTPDDEFPERLLELINDARFAWPTHLTAESLLRSKDSGSGRSELRSHGHLKPLLPSLPLLLSPLPHPFSLKIPC